jgi:predicted nuclease of predicted toxin-antitoxin system
MNAPDPRWRIGFARRGTKKAYEENWIVITNDKDFGERVFRARSPHRGVVLLRLADERSANKVETLARLLATFAYRLQDQFVVVTETQVRFQANA